MSTFTAAADDDTRTFRGLLDEAVPALPAWLENRRWFSDKGRTIASIEFNGLHLGRAEGDLLALVIAEVRFSGGGHAYYFVPLAMTDQQPDTDSIVGNGSALVDAASVSAFGPWLLELMSTFATSEDGRWVFTSHPGATTLLEAAREQPATVLRGEQSNTSIRFGDTIIAKLVRRLQPAPNPEEEILRGLTGAGFGAVPAYVGGGSWTDDDGTVYPLLLTQAVVPNVGNGWSWMLRRLNDLVAAPGSDVAGGVAPEQLLGQRTAEMHIALSQVPGTDFTPSLPESADIEANRHRSQAAARQAIELLRERAGALSAGVRADLPRINDGLLQAAASSDGFAAEADVARIRVHGDYHLGQTLRTVDGDWAIIDFEGEPARPISERRQKTSALKDVAGMLRSFAYARGAAERSLPDPLDATAKRRLRKWEQGARKAFLQGYRDAIQRASIHLVPTEDPAFDRALAAWEIDKALYEIAYEARNRPDWIEIPLLTLVPEQDSQQP